MSWIEKEDCLETLRYYKEICRNEDEAYVIAAEVLGMSPDRLIEIVGVE